MKRLVFLFIASLMAHYSALAETILPFVQDGKVWVYDVSNFIYDWEETFSLEGDTLIGTRNCLKLYYTCQVYGQEHVCLFHCPRQHHTSSLVRFFLRTRDYNHAGQV